jgi:hypothetical protein
MTLTTASDENTSPKDAAPRETVAALAKGPVFALAAGVGILLLLTSGRYGYFGDELYFLAAGHHLAWGYVDQPPVLPLLARAMDELVPGSVVALRVPAILVTAVGVVVAALIARELGGGRRAQVLTAAAYATCGQILGTGHYLATSTVDPFLWAVLLWLVVRWLRTRADGLLVWAGAVTGLALNVKLLVLAFWIIAGVAVLVLGPREILRRPALWVGAGIAALATVPTIVWQAANGWPQLEMGAVVSGEVDNGWGGRWSFVPGALGGAGLVTGAVLVLYGLWRLLHAPDLRSVRFLGWTMLGLTAVFIVSNGRFYYISGMYVICWAAAGVSLERGLAGRWWRWLASWPVYLLSALVTLPNAVPIWPASWIAHNPALPRPAYAAEEMGWPEVADAVAGVYSGLPEEQRRHTAIVTGFYWQAGALARFGPERGLPEPYSANRGYYTLGVPPESADTVLYVGWDASRLAEHFTLVRQVSTMDTHVEVINYSRGMPIWLATGRTGPWSAVWPQLRNLTL